MAITYNTPKYGNVFVVADSFDELRSIPPVQLQTGYLGVTSGKTTAADGYGQMFVWDASSDKDDDDANVIAPAESAATGRWVISARSIAQLDFISQIAGPTGANLIGTAAAGAGALTRTVGDKLGEIVSVADYLVPDSTGDHAAANTTAFNAALAATSGKARLHWPAGFIAHLNNITMSVQAHVVLDGTWVLAAHQNKNIIDLASSNITIEGSGTLDGNRTNQSGVAGQALGGICSNCLTTTGEGVTPPMPLPPTSPVEISNVRISGVTITNCWNWPVSLGGASDLVVQGTTLSNSGNSPQFFTNTSDYKFINNTVHDCTDGGFVAYHGNKNGIITGNLIYSCNDGIGVYTELGSLPSDSFIMINNNIIRDIVDGGIGVTTGTSPTGQFNIQIHDNLLTRCNTGGTNGKGSIGVVAAQGVSIRGNFIEGDGATAPSGVATYSIYVNDQSDSIEIVGNMIGNVGSAAANGTCIYIGGTTRAVVSDNTFFDTQTTTTTACGVAGAFGLSGVMSANRALGNLTGATIQAYRPTGTELGGQMNYQGRWQFSSGLEIVDPGNQDVDNPLIISGAGVPSEITPISSIYMRHDAASPLGLLYASGGGGWAPVMTGAALTADYTTTQVGTLSGSIDIVTEAGTLRIPVQKVS